MIVTPSVHVFPASKDRSRRYAKLDAVIFEKVARDTYVRP